MTQARGSFTMKFERYEEVPAADAKKIIEAAKLNMEEEEEYYPARHWAGEKRFHPYREECVALDWYVARLGPKDEFPGLHLGWAAGVWSICSGSRRYFFAPAKAV